MPTKYKQISGFTDSGIETLYNEFTNYFKHVGSGTHIEVGTWLGRSLCLFAELAQEKKLNIKIYGIDNFLGEVNAADQQEIVKNCGGSIYYKFLQNMKEAGVRDLIIPYQLTSEQAVELFDDNSIDTLFLDSEHLYDHVKREINNWWPKVTSCMGYMGLHDYYEGTQVKQAVDEWAKENNKTVYVCGTCAVIQK